MSASAARAEKFLGDRVSTDWTTTVPGIPGGPQSFLVQKMYRASRERDGCTAKPRVVYARDSVRGQS